MKCITGDTVKIKSIASGNIRAKVLVKQSAIANLSIVSKLKAPAVKQININSDLSGISNFKSKTKVTFGLVDTNSIGNANIRGKLKLDGVIHSKVIANGKLNSVYTDKIGGFSIDKYLEENCLEKLYPTQDIITSLNNTYFVNKNLSSGNLYQSIDEGIFSKGYDEQVSYIQPSSIYTEGSFRYRCKVSPALIRPEESLLLIRASAPTKTYSSNIPPIYRLSNITLKNSSDDLIIKYEDITIRGDADYSNDDYKNFSTYIAKPSINYSNQNTWKNNYPNLGSGLTSDSYTLNIDFDVECLDDPFNIGFDFGYSEGCELQTLEPSGNDYLAIDGSPLSTRTQGYSLNPNNSIRITAIEICNSGSRTTLTDNYLPFYHEVPATGFRITRSIYPNKLLINTFNTTIYPQENSIWTSYPTVKYNTTSSGTSLLKDYLRNESTNNYITLDSTSSIPDSGKLKLVFSHEPPKFVSQYTGGAFEFGGLTQSQNFDTARWDTISEIDNYFTIDKIDLVVIANKAVGTRDYIIDAVGYSDDKILCSTPKIGGFLQNIENSGGYLPVSSGFNSINDLGISSESLSDKYQFYSVSGTNNSGGDHYALCTAPIINSTGFQEYTIPLKIYEDTVELGQSVDYSMSSYFEKLYLDLFPIPSGASIAHIKLVVSYKPTNALKLHTIGHGSQELYRRLLSLNLVEDYVSSSGSSISNIPHAYSEDEPSLKYNYSTRWNGVQGSVVAGPFDPNGFDFSYYNPEMIKPFLNGYFSFNYDSGNIIISDYSFERSRLDTIVSGSYIGNYSKIKNIGLRFNSSSLFSSSTPYQTIDWTSITGYENNELYNRISDSFDNVVRVSGNLGYINFNNIQTSSGFAILTRFSPDINMSGVGFNLWNSGTIFSKYDSGQNLEFALGYSNGKLKGYARTDGGSTITIEDTAYYYEYTYPLSVMLSYNENNDKKLRLFTSGVKAESSSFNLYSGTSNLTFGYSSGSGIGINAFLTNIGISTSSGTNILSTGTPLKLQKQILYDNFLNDKLYSFIDDETDDWHIGDFKICSFNQAYDRFTKRIGSDFLIHQIKSDGSGYFNITNTILPSSISSGVSYHSQIENDFLRFYLEDVENVHEAFHSINPRISKNLPRDYDFAEKALVVETILDHTSYNNIVWSDGNVGPKLIVSLYTKNQNPKHRPDKINWGLINRHSHYLEPSGCYQKLSSIFSYDNLIDVSEQWANFDTSISNSEFDHKYYSKDINDMFLQYDLVYPSGSSYESIIKLHSAQIKLENAFIQTVEKSGQLNLSTSGAAYQYDFLNLYSYGLELSSGQFNLYTSGVVYPSSGNINLFTVGGYNGILNLSVTSSSGIIDNIGNNILYSYNYTLNPSGNGFNLFTVAQSGLSFAMPLTVINTLADQTASYSMPLYTLNKLSKYLLNDTLNLTTRASSALSSPFSTSIMNLFTSVETIIPKATGSMDLFIYSYDPKLLTTSIPLFSITTPQFTIINNQTEYFKWDSDNIGKAISTSENNYAFLDANDEIRGVETICYGNCLNGEPCTELEIKTHDTIWYPEQCFDGGVVRAKTTYTNLATSGFKTPIGYSGHYYGIRKFDNLIPNVPYNIQIVGKTGDDTRIKLPNIIEEAEYGYNNNANYSGIKLIADEPYSVSGRNAGDKYGSSIDILGDLMVVGSPFHTLYDSGNYPLPEAGAVFVYRRATEPSGHTWNYHKAGWNLETKLTLPSAILRDYYTDTNSTLIIDDISYPIKKRNWYVGQEGRQFGHSLSLSKRNNKEILAVSGPSAKFSRTFEELNASGVNICLFVFTDEFVPNPKGQTYKEIKNAIEGKDLVFQYFSDPPVKFNVKLVICEPVGGSTLISEDFPEPKPDFITKVVIDRHRNDVVGTAEYNNIDNLIYSGIKSGFDAAFPYDNQQLNNNIPAIVGVYVDDSRSLGERAVEPALSKFLSYYQNYAFASGLVDFYGSQSSGVIIKNKGLEENWVSQSINILNSVLDTGNLAINDRFKLFSSGIGPEHFNSTLSEFNTVPNSGGAVYIFENNASGWSLKQTINSPTQLNNVLPDRFGHTLDMSKNGELLVIGSPYINEAIMTYEYNSNLDLYVNNFIYRYSDIPFIGSWSFLTEKYCPTSRLGYSVAVNEDGSIIAAGAPTDSMDEFDDTNSYYSPDRPQYTVWPAYVNAGAVRVFESRKYFPHSKAVEYGIFGNLDYKDSDPQYAVLYNHMNAVFDEIDVDFIKTEFTDVDIPQDAGLLILNTPYIDSLSDEIVDNIKEWLALGDRNLVLVGNDPTWEQDGKYKVSNDIINKLLGRLNSRMRITSARNQNESVPYSGILNIISSTRPNKGLKTYINTSDMYGSGVGDIRMHWPAANQNFGCDEDYIEANDRCNMPIKHSGDLRAEWALTCQNFRGETIGYNINWPSYFGTVTPKDYGCDNPEFENIPPSPIAGYDPLPLLAAAEYFTQSVVFPAIPERVELVPTGYETVVTNVEYSAKFGSPVNSTKAFEWSESENAIYDSFNINMTNTLSQSKFYNPVSYNSKDPLLQAKASNKVNIVKEERVVSSDTYFAAEEDYSSTNSKIILIAGTFTERASTLLNAQGDRNINFYANLVSKNENGQAYIAQLSDWTQNSSFTDGDSLSAIKQKLEDIGNIVDEDIDSDALNRGHLTGITINPVIPYDVCWIANPKDLPNNSQLQSLIDWLSVGDKKLIITYDNSISSAVRIKKLCELLEVSMKPLYLTEKSKFANSIDDRKKSFGTTNICEYRQQCILLNTNHYASIGFRTEDIISKIDNINPASSNNYIPIELNNATVIAYNTPEMVDDNLFSIENWQLKTGVAELKFDVEPTYGYKLFINFASEHESENQPITCYVAQSSSVADPNPSLPNQTTEIVDIDNNDQWFKIKDDYVSHVIPLTPDSFDGTVITKTANVQIPAGIDKLVLYFTGNNPKLDDESIEYTPRTTRLISVSGVRLNIDLIPNPKTKLVPIYQELVFPAIPERVITLPPKLREISTDSNKYCRSKQCADNFDNPPIADGPVVVAQELEQISSFEYGVNRSRITIIADSSLIQGPTIANNDKVIHNSHRSFIQSLYPKTEFPINNGSRSFDIVTKIMSPERGSPQIYYSSLGQAGLNTRFYAGSSGTLMSDIKDHFNDYATFTRALHPSEAEDGDSSYTSKRPEPLTEKEVKTRIDGILSAFSSYAQSFGGSPKFSGVINGTLYEDVGSLGGMPKVMQDTGYDYLDFDNFKYGYPGNLFGYSIDIRDKTIIIGAPFVAYSGENIISWSGVQANTPRYTNPSGSLVGYNGGAGSVYVYEKTGSGLTPYGKSVSWSVVKKLRPQSINIGQDITNLEDLTPYLGNNAYGLNDLDDTRINDQFGYCVSIDSDTLIVGSPGHDFENYYENIYNSGTFIRKEFGVGFDIPKRNIYDLGSSGVRNSLDGSGIGVLNNGAAYIYENRLTDFANRTQDWTLIQKIVPQGYNSRLQKTYAGSEEIPVSGSENDRFGSVIAIDKTNRSDGDYTIALGVKAHKFATSGNHISNQPLLDAGAAYSYDLMLKEQKDITSNPNSWIQAKIFGQGSGEVRLGFNNINGYNLRYINSGIIYSTNDGKIFIEASGQDYNSNGFINHRPYIEYVDGTAIYGTNTNNNLNIYISGAPFEVSGNMNLISNAADTAIVYNNLGLYEYGVIDIVSGVPNGLFLYTDCPSGITIHESGFNLYTSGTGFSTENLDLRIRGK